MTLYINDDGLNIEIYCTTLTMQLCYVNNKVKYFTCFSDFVYSVQLNIIYNTLYINID